MTGRVTERDRRDHIRPLTSLRFVAALWVLLHHAMPRGASGSFADAVGSTGWLGVSLFFVLSGFLLTIRYAADGALRGTRGAFWRERAARLLPTYLLSLAFAALLFARDARVGQLAGGRIAAIATTVLTGQQAWRPETACEWNCPAWSLSVEFWFYLIFPFIIGAIGVWLLRGARRMRGLAVLVFALTASAIVFPGLERAGDGWPLPIYSLSPLARWPEFLAGIGLAGLIGGWSPTTRRPGLALLAGGVAWLVSTVLARDAIVAAGSHLLPVALPGFVMLIAGAWALRAHAAPLLGAASLVLLGEASYALYLFHAPLHGYLLALTNRVVGRGYDGAWALFAVYLALALGLSVLIHLRFEAPWRGRVRGWLGLPVRRS